MTNTIAAQPLDLDKLEALARDIESTGAWDFDTADTPFRIAGGEVVGGDALPYGDVYTMKEWETPDGSECLTIAQEVGAQFGKYIAAFDPPTVLALIAQARAAKVDTTASANGLLNSDELAAFNRFCECAEDFDSGGHDVDKEMMAKLARIGVVRSTGFGRHETTAFGDMIRDGRATLAPVAAQQAAAKAPAAPAVDAMRECPDCEGSARTSPNELCGRCNASGILPAASPASTPEASQQAAAVAAPSEHVATVEAGKFANRLQWVSDEAMASVPVGSKLYASPAAVAATTSMDAPLYSTRQDAARYRFLEEQCRTGTYRGIISREAIDAAMRAAQGGAE